MGKKYQLIRVMDKTKHQRHYFAIDKSSAIDSGSFADVYMAYPFTYKGEFRHVPPVIEVIVDEKDIIIDKTKKFVAKVISTDEAENHSLIQSEYECTKPYITCYQPEPFVDKKHVFIMEYIPGWTISQHKSGHPIKLRQASFYERCQMAFELIMAYYPLPHDSVATGEAIFHRDIKGENLKLNISKKDKLTRIDLRLLDFGLSHPVSKPTYDIRGTPGYISSESLIKGEHTVKSELFAIAPILASIFGATYPIKASSSSVNSSIFFNRSLDMLKQNLNMQGIFSGQASIPQELNHYCGAFTLEELISNFIKRMRHDKPEKRPNLDVVLQFFTKLNQISLHYQALCEEEVDASTAHKQPPAASVHAMTLRSHDGPVQPEDDIDPIKDRKAHIKTLISKLKESAFHYDPKVEKEEPQGIIFHL